MWTLAYGYEDHTSMHAYEPSASGDGDVCEVWRRET
jgi:hypothetical protein